MAFSDMQARVADELSRSDLTSQIALEINSAITFYQNKRFWFNEKQEITITTIAGQRYYTLPPNFAAILEARSQIGNLVFPVPIQTEQYLDSIDWTNQAVTNYITGVSFYDGKVRVYPPPVAGVPVYLKGTVLLPPLTTTAPTKTYAKNTGFTIGDTVLDANGNIQTAQTTGTTGPAATNVYAANTAFTAAQTVLDGNGNTQTCTTPGTSGYILAVDKTQWSTELNGITTDGSTGLTWTLTAKQWNTNYSSFTVDGSVVWKLTTNTGGPWTIQAEELIRTRAARMVLSRYIQDRARSQEYAGFEKECLTNMYEKNQGQTAQNWVRPHF